MVKKVLCLVDEPGGQFHVGGIYVVDETVKDPIPGYTYVVTDDRGNENGWAHEYFTESILTDDV